MNFRGQIFSGVSQPQDVWDEEVSSAPAHWEDGEWDEIVTELRRIFHCDSNGFLMKLNQGFYFSLFPVC